MSKSKKRKQKSKKRRGSLNIFDIMEDAKEGRSSFDGYEFRGR